jgi:uncharacterized protein
MKISKSEVLTANARSYLKQLCRHWGHRFPVDFNGQLATIRLPQAVCTLNATPAALIVHLVTEEEAAQDQIEEVVAEHLQRFAFRETLTFRWVRSS